MLINVPDDVTVLAVADFAESIGCEILLTKGIFHLVRPKKTEENKTSNSENPPKSKPFESAMHIPRSQSLTAKHTNDAVGMEILKCDRNDNSR